MIPLAALVTLIGYLCAMVAIQYNTIQVRLWSSLLGAFGMLMFLAGVIWWISLTV